MVYSRLGEQQCAVEQFRAAVALNPGHAGHCYNLGAALRFLGDFPGSEQAYEAALQAEPQHYRAHWALAGLRRQTVEHNHIARLEGLLAGIAGDVDGELLLRHALAKEYEDLGELATAWAHLAAGKRRKRAALAYSFEQDRCLFEAAARCGGSEPLSPAGHDRVDRMPIFVLGMPRTGTTLVERILSCHPQVKSAGELQALPVCVKQSTGSRSPRVLDAETLARSVTVDGAAVARCYLERARAVVGGMTRFVDKMPLNFFYVGLIHRVLPGARIVCLRRNPMDACLSNYRQLFALDFPYYHYNYALEDVADYYLAFDRLMAHWRRLLPAEALLELHYERLIGDQEAETRRLLDFCGLSWDPACLEFERNEAPVTTASAVQVRERLYTGAVGRWRRYGDLLQPLVERLEGGGIPVQAQ